MLRRQLDGVFTPPEQASPGLPDDLARTITSLLARDPNQRPPSANEVAEALAGNTAAYVPEHPDTWNLDDVRPSAPPVPAAEPARTVQCLELPAGTFSVVLSRGLLTTAQPEKLANAVDGCVDCPTTPWSTLPPWVPGTSDW